MRFYFENKNVIFLLNSPELGGAEKQALTLAGYLQNSCSCTVTIYSVINRPQSKTFDELLKMYELKNFYTVKNPLVASRGLKKMKVRLKLLRFALMLRKHRADILIPYLNKPSIIAYYSQKISGAKLTFWNNRGKEFYRNDYLENYAAKRSRFFLVNSPDSIIDLNHHLDISNEKIFFIPNFLAVNATRCKDNLVSKINNNKVIIGMVANFRPEKLQKLLLEVFKRLKAKYINIELHLVGAFPESQIEIEIRDFVKSNGLMDSVRIISGKSGETTIPFFDIAVLVSLKEGMSNSIMEYMYFKKAIVCTNLSGNEYLLGNSNKFLINNDTNELYCKLEMLIRSKEIRIEEGNKNYDRIIKKFNVSNYVEKLETIINTHSA